MSARPLGISLILLGLAAGGVGGTVLVAPGAVQGWFSPVPPEGTVPARIALPAALAPPRSDPLAALPPTNPPTGEAMPVRLAAEEAVVSEAASAVAAGRVYPGDAKAAKAMTEAEGHFRAFRWERAVASARLLERYDANPTLKHRAAELIAAANGLADLFKRLDDSDELQRNHDTSPSLVRIASGKEPLYAVPIVSVNEPVAIDKDPLGHIARTKAVGKVPFLVRGRKDFFPTELEGFGAVTLVDVAPVLAEKRREFEAKLGRLSASRDAADALAWYEAGKFAYRNRLDDQVTAQLSRALRLDRKLVQTVREDKAASLFSHLLAHLKQGNKTQAAAYMAAIDRRYKDTEQGRQARLYFEGRQAELIKAAQEAAAKAAEAERQRHAELKRQAEAAKRAGDEAAAREAEAAASAAAAKDAIEREAEAALARAGSGTVAGNDERAADANFAKGRELYAKAIEMGNTSERDRLYGEAAKFLSAAVQAYAALVDQEKVAAKRTSLEFKLLEANKLKFGSIKQRRFH